MKKEVFLAKVKEEANHLRNSLSDAQKAKMDYNKLKPSSPTLCLLGQVFGKHDSVESLAVLPKSVFNGISIGYLESVFISRQQKPNVKFDRIKLSDVKMDNLSHSTYLETFLICDANTEDLFKFVKGEIEEFEPEFNEVAEEVEL
jgi:hypothetical protein